MTRIWLGLIVHTEEWLPETWEMPDNALEVNQGIFSFGPYVNSALR